MEIVQFKIIFVVLVLILGRLVWKRSRTRQLMQMFPWILRKKQKPQQQLTVVEPSKGYLQEDVTKFMHRKLLHPEMNIMRQNLYMLGHISDAIFKELFKHKVTVNLERNQQLFCLDSCFSIVLKGSLSVHYPDTDGSTVPITVVKKGEPIYSLLSLTKQISGGGEKQSITETVSATALEESTVLQLPVSALQEIFAKRPEALIRTIQIIMVRLRRVHFLAIHQYLGLSYELVSKETVSAKGSPTFKASTRAVVLSDSAIAVLSDEQKKRYTIEAGRGLAHLLGLEDSSLLDGKFKLRSLNSVTYVMMDDAQEGASLVYVVSGTMSVSLKTAKKSYEDAQVFEAHTGDLVGGMDVLTGETSSFAIGAKQSSLVATLSKTTISEIMAKHPSVALRIAQSVVHHLPPFVRQFDFAVDFIFVEGGRAIYRQDEQADSIYIVLSGRLRSVITHDDGKKEMVTEYVRGDIVGTLEMLSESHRNTTVFAVRDSELVKLDVGMVNVIKDRYPKVIYRLINHIGQQSSGLRRISEMGRNTIQEPFFSKTNFSTVAVLPVSENVPLALFSKELNQSLCRIGPSILLTSKSISPSLMDKTNEYRLLDRLAHLEDQNHVVLYQCDQTLTPWTKRCIRQADCILIVALAGTESVVSEVEKKFDTIAVRSQKKLILLHKEGADMPTNTVNWLNARSWCSSHHHVQLPARILQGAQDFETMDRETHLGIYKESIHSDFPRLARLLTGESVGLVLGGGGARGYAHVGIMRAILEAGIPIDMVGGVSIGAFMGALWCSEKNLQKVEKTVKKWSKDMTKWWRYLIDVTFPIISWFRGTQFNQSVIEIFGNDSMIEDLWLPFFSVTTDITSSCMRVHTHGSLWRYVRSSMSLSGILPPLCDPVDGHLLLDGGYVNNLPADVMRSRGARHILAIDVGMEDETDLTNYGDTLSGFWVLWKWLNPFTNKIKVLHYSDIQTRLAFVSCVRQLEEVKKNHLYYTRPPIQKYSSASFGRYDEIKDVGYKHGKMYLASLKSAEKDDFIPLGTVKPFSSSLCQMLAKFRDFDDLE